MVWNSVVFAAASCIRYPRFISAVIWHVHCNQPLKSYTFLLWEIYFRIFTGGGEVYTLTILTSFGLCVCVRKLRGTSLLDREAPTHWTVMSWIAKIEREKRSAEGPYCRKP